MKFTISKTRIEGAFLFKPKIYNDSRGLFFESFNAQEFEKTIGQKLSFPQDNQSKSRRGVLRGLHFQTSPPQGKLVRVIQGKIFDVCVDLRKNSATFGLWHAEEISAENHRIFWCPPGTAHGFLTLSETATVCYKVTEYWNSESEQTIMWNDKTLAIKWPLTENIYLSKKDSNALPFEKVSHF